MEDVVIGVLALLVGALLCFNGYVALRAIIAVWGAFVGFALGAGLVASGTDGAVLASALGWVVAVALAVLFAVLAYAYYAVAVVVAMAAFGFVLGATALGALGVTWNWPIIIGSVALGVVLAFAAITANLPMLLLVVASAFSGAAVIVGAVMVLTGALEPSALTSGGRVEQIAQDWYWYAAYFVLAVLGLVVQLRAVSGRAAMRQTWEGAGRPAH
ncbi:MAG: TM7S3/TM198-like domain-containing protein [Cellulomonadaceae bacterium]